MAQYAGALHHHDFDFGEQLLLAGARVVDAGDLLRDEDASVNRSRIEEAINWILEAGAAPIVVGGDDSVAIPLLGAFAERGSFTVLQINSWGRRHRTIPFAGDVGSDRR
jgi:agmatinase